MSESNQVLRHTQKLAYGGVPTVPRTKGIPVSELLIGGLATVTAVRVFVPDAARLLRRGLAAGVMVGVASLTERGPVPRSRPRSHGAHMHEALPADEREEQV